MFRMRLHPRRALRIILVVSMVLFMLLNFRFIPESEEDNHHFQDYPMMKEGLRPVQDMHVQLVHSPQNHAISSGQHTDNHVQSAIAKPVHPKIVISSGTNQTQVSVAL